MSQRSRDYSQRITRVVAAATSSAEEP